LPNRNATSPQAVVIVQSRMGSARLPGKMMADLAGHPLIWHILQRALQIGPDLPVVLATTEHERDDVLAKQADQLNVPVVRGSEEDVLGRFLLALDQYPAQWVVRICGDSPLFDPGFLARCLAIAQKENADVVKFTSESASLYQGGEVVSARALHYSRQHAEFDPLSREHVTAWAMQNAARIPEILHTAYLDPEPGMMQDIKLSIDTETDLEKLRALYTDLFNDRDIVDLREAANWLNTRD